MNKVEELRDELQRVAKLAPIGTHNKVAEIVGISYDYLRQIRNGNNATTDNEKNQKLIQRMLDAYRQEIREYKRQLDSV